ncbi:hypothetical protein Ae168Ps1_6142 [Pseudonocardia sp. Ae168_Ps1]|nr:hypothetical protein Ae150APs1_6076 [Pseudonocardia sp. Ae150A_Ps1]OLL70677.1 hypothetical protein Ae168Ps1_6142 [Pseudonocardia sp. Ae168_Ps1]
MQPITALAELAAAVDTARAHADTARQQWRDAQTAYAHGYRAARAAGWSPTELHDIGCGPHPAGTALRATPPPTTPDTDEASSDEPSTDKRGADERGGVE